MRNRGFALLALVFVFVATAQAGTITSHSPTTINVGSAEYFITLNGTDLGNRVVFTGGGGTFDVAINSSTPSSVTSWIPIPIVLKTGTYSVISRGARSGDSNAVTLTIVNPNKPRLTLAISDSIIAIAKARLTGVKYDVGAIGGDDPQPVVNCDPPSGSLFPVGKTLVRCVATNSFGERDSGEMTVTVYDATPPVLKLPLPIVTEATQFEGAFVKYDVSASDEIDGELGANCSPASGSFFRVGVTKVSCTAADFSSNVTPGSFTVEVQGKGLRINVPDPITAEADGPTGAVVTYVATAAGTSDPRPRVTCNPKSGSRFPLGLTTVLCTATDAFGERAEGRFDVNVNDTVGPLIVELYSRPGFLIPLNKELMYVAIAADAKDLVDEKAQCVITGVTANQPMDLDDWRQISDLELFLRATNSDEKSDREYTIAVDCYDSRKNVTSSFAHVLVPRDSKEPQPGLVTVSPGKRRSVGGRR